MLGPPPPFDPELAALAGAVLDVDVAGADQLDLGGDPVPGAEVEHLLRLPDPADVRAGEGAPRLDQRVGTVALRIASGKCTGPQSWWAWWMSLWQIPT